MLDRQGIVMNQKKLRRLYQEEKLQVRRRGGREQRGSGRRRKSGTDGQVAARVQAAWAQRP